jgi:hypothetical protein
VPSDDRVVTALGSAVRVESGLLHMSDNMLNGVYLPTAIIYYLVRPVSDEGDASPKSQITGSKKPSATTTATSQWTLPSHEPPRDPWARGNGSGR